MNSWINCFSTGPFSDMNFCEIVIFACGLTYAYHYFLRFLQSPDRTRTNDHSSREGKLRDILPSHFFQ